MAVNFNGVQKAAVVLMTLGVERSAAVYQYLQPEEIEQVSLQIAKLAQVELPTKQAVLQEFSELFEAQQSWLKGGLPYAKEVLVKSLGEQRALEILQKITGLLESRPFEFLRRTDPAHLVHFLKNEHPQTIALIMSYLNAETGALLLVQFDEPLRSQIAIRLGQMDRTSPEMVREVEAVLEKKLSSLMRSDTSQTGGVDALVAVLNRVDRNTEKEIMDHLRSVNAPLAAEVQDKMFVFDNIVILDDRAVQRVLRDIDLNKTLPLALKVASDEVKELIYRNLSQRAQENVKEALTYLGPVRLRDVEEAQQQIVALIRRLEDAGEVVISRGGDEEVLV